MVDFPHRGLLKEFGGDFNFFKKECVDRVKVGGIVDKIEIFGQVISLFNSGDNDRGGKNASSSDCILFFFF